MLNIGTSDYYNEENFTYSDSEHKLYGNRKYKRLQNNKQNS